MKIEIRNLGVVEQAEIDLRPLTVFVGPNNAGKTWAAYALVGVLGEYGQNQYLSAYMEGKGEQTYPPLDGAIQQLLDEGNTQIDMVQLADEYGELYFNDVARLAKLWLQEFMGTERASLGNVQMGIQFDEDKARFLQYVKSFGTRRGLSVDRTGRALVNVLKEQGKPLLHFYTTAEGGVLNRLPERVVRSYLIQTVFQVLHMAFFYFVHAFPTERTTIITFPSGLLADILEAVEPGEPPQQRVRKPLLAVPVIYFLDLTVDAFYNRGQSGRGKQAKENSKIQTYIQLAQLLEREILGGSVDFSTPEPGPFRELLFQPAEAIKLEMPLVSSMVKELSPLVLYLRYLAEPGELIVIDEPEMNLHPQAQVQLTEFLAMLVNAGLHVLITTHSPYIIDHLVNLLKASQAEDKQAVQEKFYLKRADAFVSQDQVSVYLFENGTARNIVDKEGFIEWGTFSDVSEQISQLYFEI